MEHLPHQSIASTCRRGAHAVHINYKEKEESSRKLDRFMKVSKPQERNLITVYSYKKAQMHTTFLSVNLSTLFSRFAGLPRFLSLSCAKGSAIYLEIELLYIRPAYEFSAQHRKRLK